MRLMSGKRGLIMGLANDKSIAWGIAQALHAEGAEIGITYLGEAIAGMDRSKAGSTAPAEGLYLLHVDYPHELLTP